MRFFPTRIRVFLAAWIVSCLVSAHLDAYTLEGPRVIKLMVNGLGKTGRLFVSQKVTLYQTTVGASEVSLAETLMYKFPAAFRSEIVTESGLRLLVLSGNESIVTLDEKILGEPESMYDRYKDLLLYRSPKLLRKKLAAGGINVNVSSLGRFERRGVFVVGAEYPDESVPQIWVDKKSFMPIRWIIPENRGADTVEIRYRDWSKSEKTRYPMHIEIYRNNILEREINVESIEENPSFSDRLFDIAKIREDSRIAEKISKSENTDTMEEVKKVIDDFGKRFE